MKTPKYVSSYVGIVDGILDRLMVELRLDKGLTYEDIIRIVTDTKLLNIHERDLDYRSLLEPYLRTFSKSDNFVCRIEELAMLQGYGNIVTLYDLVNLVKEENHNKCLILTFSENNLTVYDRFDDFCRVVFEYMVRTKIYAFVKT